MPRCSPGNLLICETLRYAARQGLESYEFLGSSDPWTRVWTRDERQTVCLRIYPYNLAGVAAMAQTAADPASRNDWCGGPRARSRPPIAATGFAIGATAGSSGCAALHRRTGTGRCAARGRSHCKSAGFRPRSAFGTGPTTSTRPIVQAQYLAGLQAIAEHRIDSYESIKFPAIGCDRHWLGPVVASAIEHQVRLHFDSLADDVADVTWQAAVEAARVGAEVSCSVPGRWRRSRGDCLRAMEAGILIRVVKGQWPDPTDPTIDLRAGFLSVVEELAGRVPRVAIATHDVALARRAIARLHQAGTMCEWELLYGLPSRAARAAARKLGVSVRYYIPYGDAYLPYCLSQARRNPRLLAQLIWDVCQVAPAAEPLGV